MFGGTAPFRSSRRCSSRISTSISSAGSNRNAASSYRPSSTCQGGYQASTVPHCAIAFGIALVPARALVRLDDDGDVRPGVDRLAWPPFAHAPAANQILT